MDDRRNFCDTASVVHEKSAPKQREMEAIRSFNEELEKLYDEEMVSKAPPAVQSLLQKLKILLQKQQLCIETMRCRWKSSVEKLREELKDARKQAASLEAANENYEVSISKLKEEYFIVIEQNAQLSVIRNLLKDKQTNSEQLESALVKDPVLESGCLSQDEFEVVKKSERTPENQSEVREELLKYDLSAVKQEVEKLKIEAAKLGDENAQLRIRVDELQASNEELKKDLESARKHDCNGLDRTNGLYRTNGLDRTMTRLQLDREDSDRIAACTLLNSIVQMLSPAPLANLVPNAMPPMPSTTISDWAATQFQNAELNSSQELATFQGATLHMSRRLLERQNSVVSSQLPQSPSQQFGPSVVFKVNEEPKPEPEQQDQDQEQTMIVRDTEASAEESTEMLDAQTPQVKTFDNDKSLFAPMNDADDQKTNYFLLESSQERASYVDPELLETVECLKGKLKDTKRELKTQRKENLKLKEDLEKIQDEYQIANASNEESLLQMDEFSTALQSKASEFDQLQQKHSAVLNESRQRQKAFQDREKKLIEEKKLLEDRCNQLASQYQEEHKRLQAAQRDLERAKGDLSRVSLNAPMQFASSVAVAKPPAPAAKK